MTTAEPAPSADDELVQRYLTHVRVEKRLAARTQTLYEADLAKLTVLAAQAGVALTAVQPAHVRRWVAQMHGSGRTPRGIALILSGWRGFYHWLGREGRVTQNPVVDVRAPKASKPLPKALGVEEAVALAAFNPVAPNGDAPLTAQRSGTACADEVMAVRDRCMVELLYGCGLRLGELLGLDVDARPPAVGWVDAQAGEVHVLGKGAKRRSVPVGQPALRALAAWLAVRPQWLPMLHADEAALNDGVRALFITPKGRRMTPHQVRAALRQRSADAGLMTPVHPHMLRHSFASHVLQSSGDLRAVQELLGHAHIATTQVYTRLDFQHLARAYDAAHPRAQRVSTDDEAPDA